ncbi:hypothetical protein M0R45_000608 [Rubus argutus]|uniref:RNase H type-1 domain-containing protein n=1 Tax=Rubus argutus TaxID=59490 RepID=A0AAW1VNU6_RUBAR
MGVGLIHQIIVHEKKKVLVKKIVSTPPFAWWWKLHRTPLSAGWWKLNYAFAYNRTSRRVFACCILRDQNAQFKAIYAGCVGNNVHNITLAALNAFRCAAGLAASEGGDPLEIEGENQTVFRLLRGEIPSPNETTRELVGQCLGEFNRLRMVWFRCVEPHANVAANRLARIAMNTEQTWFFVDNLPAQIAEILNIDVNGHYVP